MIEIKKLNKKFSDNFLFRAFELQVNDGEMIAIVGKSGCGKTTLLNMLGLIDYEYSGTIMYDHVDIKKLNASKRQKFIRNHINYLFQNYALIDDATVEQNMEIALYYEKLSKEEKKARIRIALQKVGLSNYEKKKVFTLSGGEQQRVSLARAMIKKGNVILADEPTGNLDEENRDIVLNVLLEQNKEGKTIIIVTHDPYVANRCRRIISVE